MTNPVPETISVPTEEYCALNLKICEKNEQISKARKKVRVLKDSHRAELDCLTEELTDLRLEVDRLSALNEEQNIDGDQLRHIKGMIKELRSDWKEISQESKRLHIELGKMKTMMMDDDNSTNGIRTQISRMIDEQMKQITQEWEKRYQNERIEKIHLREELQELRGNIKVMVRIRPTLNANANASSDQQQQLSDDECIQQDHVNPSILNIQDEARLTRSRFEFDTVFNQTSTNREVFAECLRTSLKNLHRGFNVSILAYGQTGSGKTFTMSHLNQNVLQYLFAHKSKYEQISEIKMRVFEVYLGKVFDLGGSEKSECKLREIPKTGKVIAEGLSDMKIENAEQALGLLEKCSELRCQGATDANQHSSRSHMIVTVVLRLKTDELGQMDRVVHLQLVDLAGSERVNVHTSSADSIQRKEGIAINGALSTLSDVLRSRLKGSKHIPFRNSALTWILKEALSRDTHSRVCFIAHVTPLKTSAQPTISTLKFAKRVRDVTMK